MTGSHDINPEPDHQLGGLLREHLSGDDSARFVARVLERLPLGGNTSAWEILAGWARPGLAAALLLATLTGFWMATRQDASNSVEVLAVTAGNVSAPAESVVAV